MKEMEREREKEKDSKLSSLTVVQLLQSLAFHGQNMSIWHAGLCRTFFSIRLNSILIIHRLNEPHVLYVYI